MACTPIHALALQTRLISQCTMTNILPEAPVHEAARDLHVKFQDQLKGLWKHRQRHFGWCRLRVKG